MPDRILIIRLSALGDILHALPMLAAIRKAKRDAHIGWLVEDRAASLLQGHPMIDALHVVPRKAMKAGKLKALAGPMRALRAELRAQRYDFAIDPQGLTKSALWARLSGARRRVGFRGEDAKELSRFCYNTSVAPAPDEFHVIRRNLALLRPLGIENPAVEFPLHLPKLAEQKAKLIWGTANAEAPRVVINPGAGWPTKQWPAEEFGRLGQRLADECDARVVIAWGPGEEPLLKRALDAAAAAPSRGGGSPLSTGHLQSTAIGPAPGVYPLPETAFVELGAVVKTASLFVGGDTGPTHLAAALGVPVVSPFGASDAKRNGPWGAASRVIQLSDPPCIPCWKTSCAYAEPLACLKRITLEQVAALCLEALASKGN